MCKESIACQRPPQGSRRAIACASETFMVTGVDQVPGGIGSV